MIDEHIESEDLNNIIPFLKTLDLFKNLDHNTLSDLASSFSLVTLKSGDVLIHQDNIDTSLYILWHGRLRVFVKNPQNSEMNDVAEISSGHVVGEIAFLTDQPRTATVIAIRDSMALKLKKESFALFEKMHPHSVIGIAKLALKRLTSKKHSTQSGEKIISIVVAPSGTSGHVPFVHRLVEKLNTIKPTILMTAEKCNSHFGSEVSQTSSGTREDAKINHWLLSLENDYGYVIYQADRQMTNWTKRCIRQADFVFLVAEDGASPEFNSIERDLFSRESRFSTPCIEMAFIHSPETRVLKGTHSWLDSRPVHGYHHLSLESTDDFEKLKRFLTGKAFGLVLNGGGVRAFTHAGVIKALSELKIPVDFYGGTSMGAVLGAASVKYGVKGMLELLNDNEFALVKKDYTLPVVSLLKGKNINKILQDIYGDVYIEDLWTRFFCVSTNLTQSKVEVHSKGLLWWALRASTALPGIYPPIYNPEGNMLVDGGVMNNMPVDVMRNLLDGGKILAANCHIKFKEQTKYFISDTWTSGWKLFFQGFNPFAKKIDDYHSIFNILRKTYLLGNAEKQRQMGQAADFLLEFDTGKYKLMNFEDMKELIDMGYRETMEKLPPLLAKSGFHTQNLLLHV